MQGISNHTYQDLIQDLSFIIRKTEDKCKFHVIRVGASTNRNMIGGGANEVQNFTASAYSIWSDRTFGPYWLFFKFYIVTSRYAICSAVIICASLWWHVKMMICPG